MNKKRFYILASTLLLIGLTAGLVQYLGAFDVLYAAATNPGHSWSEMDCDNNLCIDIANSRVGIGTKTPGETLEINGNIKVNGNVVSNRPVGVDDLTTKGYVDEKIAEVSETISLVNGAHSQGDCTDAKGEVVDSDVSYKICQITAASCPSGWTQYKNYSTAEAYTTPFLSFCYSPYYTCAGYSCASSAKTWANASYTCTNTIKQTYTSDVPCCVARCYQGPSSSYGWNEYFFTAKRIQIGCY